jgi:hypothetical protein
MAFRKLSDFSSSGLLAGGRTPAERWRPPEHVAGFSEITGVHIVCPQIEDISLTLAMTQAGVVNSNAGSFARDLLGNVKLSHETEDNI